MTNSEQDKPELKLVQNLAELLTPFGTTSIEYISAEMQPYTNQFKPDLVFIPNSGGYAGQVIVIEAKMRLTYPQRLFTSLAGHKLFFEDYLERQVSKYIIATDADIDDILAKKLSAQGVLSIGGVKSPNDVVKSLRDFDLLA